MVACHISILLVCLPVSIYSFPPFYILKVLSRVAKRYNISDASRNTVKEYVTKAAHLTRTMLSLLPPTVIYLPLFYNEELHDTNRSTWNEEEVDGKARVSVTHYRPVLLYGNQLHVAVKGLVGKGMTPPPSLPLPSVTPPQPQTAAPSRRPHSPPLPPPISTPPSHYLSSQHHSQSFGSHHTHSESTNTILKNKRPRTPSLSEGTSPSKVNKENERDDESHKISLVGSRVTTVPTQMSVPQRLSMPVPKQEASKPLPVPQSQSVLQSQPVTHSQPVLRSQPVIKPPVTHSQPVPQSQPVLRSQPVIKPPVTHSQPVPQSQSVLQSQPVTHSQPVLRSQPVIKPPVTHSQPVLRSQPVIKPPVTHSQPVSQSQPVLRSQPVINPPVTHSQPVPQSQPVLRSQPVIKPPVTHSQPVPQSQPVLRSQPVIKPPVTHSQPVNKHPSAIKPPVVSKPSQVQNSAPVTYSHTTTTSGTQKRERRTCGSDEQYALSHNEGGNSLVITKPSPSNTLKTHAASNISNSRGYTSEPANIKSRERGMESSTTGSRRGLASSPSGSGKHSTNGAVHSGSAGNNRPSVKKPVLREKSKTNNATSSTSNTGRPSFQDKSYKKAAEAKTPTLSHTPRARSARNDSQRSVTLSHNKRKTGVTPTSSSHHISTNSRPTSSKQNKYTEDTSRNGRPQSSKSAKKSTSSLSINRTEASTNTTANRQILIKSTTKTTANDLLPSHTANRPVFTTKVSPSTAKKLSPSRAEPLKAYTPSRDHVKKGYTSDPKVQGAHSTVSPRNILPSKPKPAPMQRPKVSTHHNSPPAAIYNKGSYNQMTGSDIVVDPKHGGIPLPTGTCPSSSSSYRARMYKSCSPQGATDTHTTRSKAKITADFKPDICNKNTYPSRNNLVNSPKLSQIKELPPVPVLPNPCPMSPKSSTVRKVELNPAVYKHVLRSGKEYGSIPVQERERNSETKKNTTKFKYGGAVYQQRIKY